MADGQVIKAHRCILATASDVFKTMFMVEMEEKRSQEVLIEDIDYKTMKSLIEYIYSGNLLVGSDKNDALDNHLISLLLAADKYNISMLKDEVSLKLRSRMNQNECD